MYKNILIPLENSETDRAILEHIKELAKLCHAKLTLVHVADGFAARLQDQLNLHDSEEMVSDRKYLESCADDLRKEGFDVSLTLAQGEPGAEILKLAETENVDLIAMSTHGHRLVKDILFGSVAEHVRHRTDIPVLMLRAPGKG